MFYYTTVTYKHISPLEEALLWHSFFFWFGDVSSVGLEQKIKNLMENVSKKCFFGGVTGSIVLLSFANYFL